MARATSLEPQDFYACQNVCEINVCFSLEQTLECVRAYIFPTPLEWLFICLHLVLFTVGVVGNILVCFVVLRSKHMQTVTNLFIVNLAVADAVVLVLCSPPTVLQSVTETWYLGDTMCKVVVFFQNTVVGVSVLTLSAIAVERYFAICRPLKSSITSRKVTVTVLVIWLISAAMGSPNMTNTVITYFKSAELSQYLRTCETGLDYQMAEIYLMFIVIAFYLIPMVIIGIFYIIISHHLWHVRVPGTTIRVGYVTSNYVHLRSVCSASLCSPVKLASSREDFSQECVSGNGYETHAEVQLDSRKKVAKMLIAIVVLFAACYLPINLIFVLRQLGWLASLNDSSVLSIMFMFAHWLCYFNSAINPLIYNFMSVKFKKEFRNVFSCNKRPNTPLHESTYFNSSRKTRQMNVSSNSNRSATRVLRPHEFTYPTFHDAKGAHVVDDEIMVSGDSV